MGHDHGHGHGLTSASQAHKGRLVMVLAITSTIMVVEVIGAAISGSLALLADAGHMLTDVAGIGLSLLAIWFGARPATPARTFGYYRVEILAAVINAVLLFGVAGFVWLEAWRRLRGEPPEVAGGLMLVVALVGLTANGVSMWLLKRGQAESLNVRGAYLEVFGDLLGSVAVLVAAVVIALTGFQAADPIASVLIGLLIVPRVLLLLRDAVDVLLEATPKGVDMEEVRRHLVETDGVADVHDLHAWTITSGMPVLSVHVVLAEGADSGQVLDRVSACVAGHFDVEHSTFQLEQPTHREHEPRMHT